MKILFFHGWHSVPGGVKPIHLTQHGHEVIDPALNDEDFDAALRTTQAEFGKHKLQVIVGSKGTTCVSKDDPPFLLIHGTK